MYLAGINCVIIVSGDEYDPIAHILGLASIRERGQLKYGYNFQMCMLVLYLVIISHFISTDDSLIFFLIKLVNQNFICLSYRMCTDSFFTMQVSVLCLMNW